jgi:hypothetical protein
LAWIISPFGFTLAIFSLFLYIKSKRLKLEDFKFQLTTSEISSTVSESNTDDTDHRPIVTGRRTGIKDK